MTLFIIITLSLRRSMIVKGNFWIVSEFYFPVKTSTGYYVTQIAEFLSKNNSVNVITTAAAYNKQNQSSFTKNEFINGVKVRRAKSVNLNKDIFSLRVLRLLISSFQLFFILLQSVKKNEQILVVTNPAFLILFMPFLKMFRNVDYCILVHDIFPENLVAIGKLKNTSLVYRIAKTAFDRAYSKAKNSIVVGRDMKRVLVSKGVDSSKVVVIPNWSDTNEVKPMHKSETRLMDKFHFQDKFIFQFAGNLGHAQGLDNIIEAIKLVTNETLHFLFIGAGAKEAEIKDLQSNSRLDNVTHIGFQDRKNQNDFLNACDVSLVTLNQGMLGLGVPSKSYNIMATGKPILVIADRDSEISQCVNEYKIGWIAQPDNPVMLAHLFEQIFEEYFLGNKKTIGNPRNIALNHFSKELILNRYQDLFDHGRN